MFGIDGLTENTIRAVKKSGGKINLSFKGTDILAEIIIGGTNEIERNYNGMVRI